MAALAASRLPHGRCRGCSPVHPAIAACARARRADHGEVRAWAMHGSGDRVCTWDPFVPSTNAAVASAICPDCAVVGRRIGKATARTTPCMTRVQQRFMCAMRLLAAGVAGFRLQRMNERVTSVVLGHHVDMSATHAQHQQRQVYAYPSRYWPPLSTRNMELSACTRAHDFSSGASVGHGHSSCRARRVIGVSHEQWMIAPLAANPQMVSKLRP